MSRKMSPSDLRREEHRLRERIGQSATKIDRASIKRRTQRAAGLRHDAARLDDALAASGPLYSEHRGLLARDMDLQHRRTR